MTESHALVDVLVLLAAAIIAVPLMQRLRISPVLGYLAAGVAVGPFGFGFIAAVDDAHYLAEFGVIFLLFTIGLDLPFQRLRAMWRYIFGLGLAQVAVTSALIFGAAVALGLAPEAALVIGGALALSSTATVLEELSQRRELATRFGRVAIAVLLFQDLAVVPLLALLPLLHAEGTALLVALVLAMAKAVAALAGIVVLGQRVLRPVYRVVAGSRNREVFAATNLLVVLGTGWITGQLGMSMALGAFLAGLLLAETEFRHQVEADILPFRGLFLGLFFISVGMVIDLNVVAENAALVLALTLALLAGKALALAGLGRAFGLPTPVAVCTGLQLAQCGEFGFIIFSLAMQLGLVEPAVGMPLIATVALTMALTPLLTIAGSAAGTRLEGKPAADTDRLAAET